MTAFVKVREILGRDSVRKILKSFQYLGAERVIKMVAGIFIHAWLARYLGPINFGRLSFVLNFTSIFLPFVTFGVEDVLAKHFFQEKLKANDIIASQIYLRFFTGLLGFILLTVIVLLEDEFEPKYKIMLISYGATLFLRIFDVLEVFYQSLLELRPVFWARNTSYLSSSFLKLIGIWLSTKITFFLSTYFWEVFSWKTFNILTYLRTHKIGKVSQVHVVDYLKESFPLFLGSFIVMLDLKLGNIVLKKVFGDAEVGNFSVVMILIELWNFIPAAICISLYPAMFNAKEGRSGNYAVRVQYLYDFLFWLGVSFAVVVTLISPYLVQVLYGNKFPEIPSLLAMASWMAIMSFLSYGRIKFYTLEGKLKDWVSYTAVSLVINLLFQLLLVSKYESKGVFIAMISSPYLAFLICSIFSRKIREESLIFFRCFYAPFRWIKHSL